MQTYTAIFSAGQSWPDMEMTVFAADLEEAGDEAAKMLQSRENTMFHTVEVTLYNKIGHNLENIKVELVETRGTVRV